MVQLSDEWLKCDFQFEARMAFVRLKATEPLRKIVAERSEDLDVELAKIVADQWPELTGCQVLAIGFDFMYACFKTVISHPSLPPRTDHGSVLPIYATDLKEQRA